jgi:hypothetical protein
VVGLVDQLLNALARGIGRPPAQEDAHDRKGQRRAEARDPDPNQCARKVLLAAFVVGSIEFGVLVHRADKVRPAGRGSRPVPVEVIALRQRYDYACCNEPGDPMITELDEEQERRDDRATLVWSLLVSGFANLMAWMLVAWVAALRMHAMSTVQDRPEPTFMVTSSSINIAKQTHPVPQQSNQQAVAQPAPRPQPQRQPAPQRAIPHPQAQPTELARNTPSGTPVPRSAPKKQQQGTLAEELAQQEVAFQHEAQQLNEQHAPLSIATIDPNHRQSATRQYRINFSGNSNLRDRGEGYYRPLRGWLSDHGLHCYYIEYTWLYPSGGTEVGDIPWPFCYLPSNDPVARHVRQIDILEPPAGYQLPSGTYLWPIEREVYEAWLHGNP